MDQTSDAPFTLTVNTMDANWNVVDSVTDVFEIAWSDEGPTLPDGQLVAGTDTPGMPLGPGSSTFTVTDVTDPGKTPSTSPPLTVTSG